MRRGSCCRPGAEHRLACLVNMKTWNITRDVLEVAGRARVSGQGEGKRGIRGVRNNALSIHNAVGAHGCRALMAVRMRHAGKNGMAQLKRDGLKHWWRKNQGSRPGGWLENKQWVSSPCTGRCGLAVVRALLSRPGLRCPASPGSGRAAHTQLWPPQSWHSGWHHQAPRSCPAGRSAPGPGVEGGL